MTPISHANVNSSPKKDGNFQKSRSETCKSMRMMVKYEVPNFPS